MDRRQTVADMGLLLVALIWGFTFVMVQEAVQRWPVFAFLALRFTIASLAFLPILLWRRRPSLPRGRDPRLGGRPSRSLLAGVLVGLALVAGYSFQTFGLLFTTPAKAGFITGLSVVLVPLGAALLLRQTVHPPAALGIFLATVGLALLSLNDDLSVNRGDLLVLLCAVSFAIQILLTGRYARQMSAYRLAAIQIATAAGVLWILALVFEIPQGLPPMDSQVAFAAVFTGLLATTLAFLVQSAAQRFTTATHTALLFSLEPVFAALASYLLIGERLGGRALMGSLLILAGMLCAELGGLWWSARQRRRLDDGLNRLSPETP